MASFKETQYAFVEHIRDPQNNAYDGGIENRRLQIYRELFFNNILGFLSSGFPVLEEIYGEENWQALARKFFSQHDSRSPYFVDISKEFVEYLSNEYQMTETDPAFLQELAHYEWLELAISIRKSDQNATIFDESDNSISTLPETVIFSELATLASYQYPVHQLSNTYQPDVNEEITYLVVYRNALDEVNFTLVNAVSAHLLTLIQQSEQANVVELIDNMTIALPQLPEEQVRTGTVDTIRQFLKQQILLVPSD